MPRREPVVPPAEDGEEKLEDDMEEEEEEGHTFMKGWSAETPLLSAYVTHKHTGSPSPLRKAHGEDDYSPDAA